MRAEPRRFGDLLIAASLPMIGALIGGALDEHRRLGFTTWRSVCRESDLRLAALADFTLQLLPLAVIGLLLGGAAVLAIAVVKRRDADHARRCLAAHAACAASLPIALLICASTLPLGLMLLADLTITVAAAIVMLRLGGASVRLRTHASSRA